MSNRRLLLRQAPSRQYGFRLNRSAMRDRDITALLTRDFANALCRFSRYHLRILRTTIKYVELVLPATPNAAATPITRQH